MQYRKKPVVINAFQIIDFYNYAEYPMWFRVARAEKRILLGGDVGIEHFVIKTLEGDMIADKLDYIIQGIKGELYPCKPDIFEATYEKVENN